MKYPAGDIRNLPEIFIEALRIAKPLTDLEIEYRRNRNIEKYIRQEKEKAMATRKPLTMADYEPVGLSECDRNGIAGSCMTTCESYLRGNCKELDDAK